MTNMSTMMRRNFGKSSNPYRISSMAWLINGGF